MSAGNAHKIFFLELKMCARVVKDELRKADLTSVALHSLSKHIRLYYVLKVFFLIGQYSLLSLFPVLKQQGLVAAG